MMGSISEGLPFSIQTVSARCGCLANRRAARRQSSYKMARDTELGIIRRDITCSAGSCNISFLVTLAASAVMDLCALHRARSVRRSGRANQQLQRGREPLRLHDSCGDRLRASGAPRRRADVHRDGDVIGEA